MKTPVLLAAIPALLAPLLAYFLDKATTSLPIDPLTIGIVGGILGAALLAIAIKNGIGKRVGAFVGGMIFVGLQLYGLAALELSLTSGLAFPLYRYG